MIPYSNDLRTTIIRFYDNHPEYTQQEVADEFDISLSFVEKLLRRWRTTQSSDVLGHGGGQKRRLKDNEETIRKIVSEQPDITLEELQTRLRNEIEITVSKVTICRELQRLKLRRKKKPNSK